MDYEEKNYLCNKHNEPFLSYCNECNKNLCMKCKLEHNNLHKIISYKEILPNITNIKINNIIEKFKKNIDELIKLLQNISNIIEQFYLINYKIWNNNNTKNENYETFII